MKWLRAASFSDFGEGRRAVLISKETHAAWPHDTSAALFCLDPRARSGRGLYCIQNACPDVSMGELATGDAQLLLDMEDMGELRERCGAAVACPVHSFTFSLQTGECIAGNGRTEPAAVYPVRVVDDYIEVAVLAKEAPHTHELLSKEEGGLIQVRGSRSPALSMTSQGLSICPSLKSTRARRRLTTPPYRYQRHLISKALGLPSPVGTKSDFRATPSVQRPARAEEPQCTTSRPRSLRAKALEGILWVDERCTSAVQCLELGFPLECLAAIGATAWGWKGTFGWLVASAAWMRNRKRWYTIPATAAMGQTCSSLIKQIVLRTRPRKPNPLPVRVVDFCSS